MTLQTVVAKLKYHNPKWLEGKKVEDLDQILFDFQQELVSYQDISDENSKQILYLRSAIGEFKNYLTVLASTVRLLTSSVPEVKNNMT